MVRLGERLTAEMADPLQAIYERIVVTGRTIVSIRLTPSVPIEGRDEWLTAAGLGAGAATTAQLLWTLAPRLPAPGKGASE